jgi:peptidoglycan/LPS O-acetylase OafA/YrhL
VAALERGGRTRRRRLAAVEGNVALRAAAIALVVGTHASVFSLQGGAHVLLAVAGYNFARFRLTATDVADRARHAAASIARIAVPCVLWVCFMFTWREPFTVPRVLLLDNVAGDGLWRYWYVEVLLQLLVVLAVVLGVRGVREAERRAPFAAALAVLGAALVLRFGWLPLWPAPEEPMYRTDTVAWLFVLGWAAQRAERPAERALLTAIALGSVAGFFDSPGRGLLVAAGLLALFWVPTVRVPRPLNRIVAALAGASLAIFLTHFAVLPWLRGHLPPEAVWVVALAVGVAVAAVLDRVRSLARMGALVEAARARTAAAPPSSRTASAVVAARAGAR